MNTSIRNLIERLDNEYPLEEDNTTAAIPPVDTPNAFRKKEKDWEDETHPSEHYFKKIESTINELSYGDFKGDDTKNEKQKINSNLIEMNRKLREVEQMINHASKLKTESGSDSSVFWKGTLGSFVKIKERLNRLSQKIVEMNS